MNLFRIILNLVLNLCWIILNLRHYLLFLLATRNIEKVQKKILFEYIDKNKNTIFGQDHKFRDIKSVLNFQEKLPLTTYEDYKRYVDLIEQGQDHVLTKNPVRILEPSSGSSSASKYIPYTNQLRGEFQKALYPWLIDLYIHKRRLLMGRSYWSLTPSANDQKISKGGIPIGFESDSDYFGGLSGYILKKTLITPALLSQIKNIDTHRYITLLILLHSKDLTFVSVWNPTFFILLLNQLEKHSSEFINDIENGTISNKYEIDPTLRRDLCQHLTKNKKRARELKTIFNSPQNGQKSPYEQIWPWLTVISCWGDGTAKPYLENLRKLFPHVKIQEKGLLATEGVISSPLVDHKGKALAITSHFFEFLSSEDQSLNNKPLLASQLEKDKLYTVIITTGGGFYRYQLNDIIKVTDFINKCPLIQFIGKEDKISDMFGEKLNEYYIQSFLPNLIEKYNISPSFFMLAPEIRGNSGFYTLFLELPHNMDNKTLLQLRDSVEKHLRKNYHYDYCRKLGQLKEVKIFLIKPDRKSVASAVYLERQRILGQKAGNIKPPLLSKQTGWSGEFLGEFI